jgi:hypothetical protein
MALPIVGSAHERQDTQAFTWFIYGSSLSRRAFAEWAERHHYALPDFARAVPVKLDGYRLSFDVQSGFWGGAVASLTEAKDQSVEGIALPLPGAAKTLVDHKEGALSGLYEPFAVWVSPLAGGGAGATFAALAYRASAGRRLPTEATPAPSFVTALREGAKDWGLSAAYQTMLSTLG